MVRKGVLVDISRCTGCRACQVACKEWNNLDAEKTSFENDMTNPPNLSPNTWTITKFNEFNKNGELNWVFVKWQCMHCENPTCVVECPTTALRKLSNGAVVYDEGLCIGCRYCVEVCPFHVIQFDEEARKAKKCLFCIDRIQYGREPACVETCSTGALEFGGLQEITGKAMEMERQGHRLYGLREAGGVSWIYALPKGIEPKDVGLPVVPHRSYNSFSGSLLVGQTSAVALGLIAVGAFSQYLKRKEKEEGGEKQ